MTFTDPERNKNYLLDLWSKSQARAVQKEKDRASVEVVIPVLKVANAENLMLEKPKKVGKEDHGKITCRHFD